MLVVRRNSLQPELSIVLLDWSCRESFHSLSYLSNQSVRRDRYEIIWIEYYDARSPEIDQMLAQNRRRGEHPVVDTWIIMDIPRNVCYHKHYMYNVGIVAAQGRIVCFCDSDAMFTPSFVQTIIDEFDTNPGIVLHLDEVRNVDQSHYPFDHPTFEELRGKDCINWKDGKTTGLHDKTDPIHSLNYGACMCALREDLISIGGADEHIDYLGHVCGPYDMTFRLVNYGRKEIWHGREFLFHTWHPGSDGIDNYIGPHDGRNVSSRALEAIQSRRVMPVTENETIRLLRLGEFVQLPLIEVLDQMQQRTNLTYWIIDECKLAISLGRSAFYRNDYAGALRQWRTFEHCFPEDSFLWSDLGWVCYFLNEHDHSMAAFTRALLIDANNPAALRGRGWLHNRLGNFRKAVEDFSSVLPLLHESARDHIQEVYRGRGFSQYHLGCHDEAIADILSAITHTDSENHVVLHEMYHTLGHAYIRKAEAMCRETAVTDTSSDDAAPRVGKGAGSAKIKRSLMDTIRSHTTLYLLARRSQDLARRLVRKLSG